MIAMHAYRDDGKILHVVSTDMNAHFQMACLATRSRAQESTGWYQQRGSGVQNE